MSDVRVSITVDGVALHVRAGTSVAAALMNAGVTAWRRSVRGEMRGALCGMGACQECRVTVDGVAQRRACVTEVADGMVVRRDG